MPYREGQTATNPQTGQTIVFSGGQWVSASPQQGGGNNKIRRLSSQDQTYLSEQRTAAQQAADAERAAQRFLELNQQQGTGQIFSVPGISEIYGAFSPKMSEMEALTNRMAPALRQPGSGAMSDKDVAMFKKSIPNPNFPGPTNQRLAQSITQSAQRQRNYVAFLDKWAAENGTLIGAQEAWDRIQRQPAARPKPAQSKPSKGGARIISVED